jgi:hypothetical protein
MMAKDKYDFIHELLNNDKLNAAQRERILLLTSIEIKKDKAQGNILEERVKRLEEKIGLNQELEINKTTNPEPNLIHETNNTPLLDEISKANHETLEISLPKYIKPSWLYTYLLKYNQNRILRSTCHEIDADTIVDILDYCESDKYDFKKHLEKISYAFEEHDKNNFCAPATKALFRGYITGKNYQKKELINGWSSDKIKINWSHSGLLDWSTKNNIPPNSTLEILKKNKNQGFVFDGFNSYLLGKKIQTFRELVLHFKSLFHIRFDNSLNSILVKIHKQEVWSRKIEFEIIDEDFPLNIELFTDVDKLIQAYNRIVKLIIEQHRGDSNPKVKLSFFENVNSIYLSIHHLNNTYNKSLENTIERLGQTYTNLIKNQLNGMCNFYVRADFGQDGKAKINLWNGEDRCAKKDGLEDFIGVEHILEFCKSDKP